MEDKEKDISEEHSDDIVAEAEEPVLPAPSVVEGSEVEGKMDDVQDKAGEYLAGWQRAQADYANLKKDVERMREDLAKFACAGLIEKLLPVLDNFASAGAHAPDTKDDAVLQWCQGINHVQTQFEQVLYGAGLTIIDGDNVPFDPERHEAMIREAVDGVEPGTVIEILAPGYALYDKVLRAAKVKVAE